MLLGTFRGSLLENILSGKGTVRAGSGCRSLKSYKNGKGIVRADNGKEWDF